MSEANRARKRGTAKFIVSERQRADLSVVTAILILAASGSAHAVGKYQKKESDVAATQTALTKPQQRAKDDKRKPTISADDVFGGVGEKVKSVTDSQIRVLQRLIDNTNDTDPEKPDLLYRMAELYAEQQRYYNFRARELDQKVFDAQQANNAQLADKYKAEQTDYQKKESTWLIAAVKKYLEVANNDKFANYKRMDQVLFYLAYLLTQQKREDLARPIFKRLIKDYPQSVFIPDAYLSFGEYFFEQKDFEHALQFYDKVLQFPQSRVYGFARYKEGWVYFNLGDFKQALATFVNVIEMGAQHSKDKNWAPLVKESKKDCVRAFGRVGTPEKAWPFFQKIGGEYAPTMLEMLGELYNAQGQFADSIKIYRQLMSQQPKSPKLCTWQTEVLKNTLSITGAKASPDSVKELQRLAAVWDKVKDDKSLKPDAIDECRDNTANTLRELATVWHKEAQKTNDNNTYALAQYLYKEYINKFPKEKDIYVMTFYYAELLFKLGSMGNEAKDRQKYCEAAPVYTDVVKLDPSPKAKYLREAAYAAVISWKNCLDITDNQDDAAKARDEKRKELKAQKGKKTEETAKAEEKKAPRPIPDNQKKMLEAFDTYIQYVPDAPELVTIKYRKARTYYEYDHYEEAIPFFKEIVEHHIDSDLAIYSANLLLDCYAIQKDLKSVETTVDQYLGMPQLLAKDQQFAEQLHLIKCNTERKHVEQLETQQKYKDAGTMYVQLSNDCPTDPKIDEVYYNAAINFERAKLIGAAIQMRQLLISKKPDSSLAKKAVYLIGRNYQDIAAYENAAENYETFASKYGGEKDAPIALNTAAFFRRGLGMNDKAIDDTSLFVKNYGGKKEFTDKAAGVAFNEYQIFEQQKDRDRVKKHFTQYLKDWGAKGGVDRQVVAHVKMGELLWKESCPVAGVNGACIEVIRQRAGGAARVAEKQAKKDKDKKKKKKKGANLPAQCGPETKSKITVHDRKPAAVKEALAHFAEALKFYKGGASTKSVPGKDETERNQRINDMTYYAAEARMMEGDIEYEKFLKMQIPEKLDFSPAPPDASPRKQAEAKKRMEESTKKFKSWIESKTKQLSDAQKIYQNVILFKQAHWAIAASARIGQLFQDFSGQLYTAPVPKSGAPPPGYDAAEFEQMFHDAYCDAMTDQAEPLENKAIEGLGTCLNKSTELSWFNEWSQLCEAELNQIKPSEYPLAAEIRAQPGYFGVPSDSATVIPLETKP
jgi:tetratricopeptide (TPR) repeat protein